MAILALGSFVRSKRVLRDNELKCARGAGKGGVRKHSAPNRRENSTFPGTLAIPVTLLPWAGGVLLQAVDDGYMFVTRVLFHKLVHSSTNTTTL